MYALISLRFSFRCFLLQQSFIFFAGSLLCWHRMSSCSLYTVYTRGHSYWRRKGNFLHIFLLIFFLLNRNSADGVQKLIKSRMRSTVKRKCRILSDVFHDHQNREYYFCAFKTFFIPFGSIHFLTAYQSQYLWLGLAINGFCNHSLFFSPLFLFFNQYWMSYLLIC